MSMLNVYHDVESNVACQRFWYDFGTFVWMFLPNVYKHFVQIFGFCGTGKQKGLHSEADTEQVRQKLPQTK